MKKFIKRITMISLFFTVLFFGSVVYLASTPETEPEVGSLKHDAQIFSKNLIMSNYGKFKNLTESDYAPNILDKDYAYEDLKNPYFEAIREDSRLTQLYHKATYNLHDYLEMKECLRNMFPHGDNTKSHLNENLLVMIDDAEDGEMYTCGDISKMLCQMIMATGTYARTVRISDKIGLGHVVVEYWSKEYNKWILLDPDYNAYYATLDSIPLNGIELYKCALEHKPILYLKGKSVNTLWDSDLKIYKQYYVYGVAIDYYDKWISNNYGRSHPESSPINSCVYIGRSKVREKYFANHFRLVDTDVVNLVYSNPFDDLK